MEPGPLPPTTTMTTTTTQPHLVFLPFPLQGHVKPMLTLAKLLCLAGGFHVTFVNSDHNHRRLLNSPATQAFLSRHANFHFASIPDGLPPDHPRYGPSASYLLYATPLVMKPRFQELLQGALRPGELGRRSRPPPPTCVVADGIMYVAMEVAEEMGIPTVIFRTYSAHAMWMFFHFQKLIEEGEIPIKGEDMDRPITCIPGLESLLRPCNLPDDISALEPNHPLFELIISENSAITSRASALILDTFDDLEAPIISRINSVIPKTYTVGPLHALLKVWAAANSSPALDFSTSLWKEERSCMAWLDSKPTKSVLYVSFGRLAVPSEDHLLELWHGLVNSGKSFLWTTRPGVVDPQKIPEELKRATEERGLIVAWAPQEEVLAHPAVGCFFTHSGWNLTLEGICAGTPMIGCPQMFDQPLNSLCMSQLWLLGADMKRAAFSRVGVERAVRAVMDAGQREEIMESVDWMAEKARESIGDGGSSWRNLVRLINDIRSITTASGK